MLVRCKHDELVKVDILIGKKHPKNANTHPKEQITRLAKIMAYQGVRHPITISKLSGLITKGHGRLAAAVVNGWTDFPVEYQDYDDQDMEVADVHADNEIARWAELDLEFLKGQLPDFKEGFDFDVLGLRDLGLEKEGECDADATPDVRKTDIRLGDLFQLGPHRVLCGDSTQAVAIQVLMNGEKADMVFTDPPYGVEFVENRNYDKGFKSAPPKEKGGNPQLGVYSPVIGDNEDFDPTPFLDLATEVFLFGGDYYCQSLPKNGSWFVWDKHRQESDTTIPFGNEFELCWSKQKHRKEILKIQWIGIGGVKDDTNAQKRLHPTQKPVQVPTWFIERFSVAGNLLLDPFLGSGSTLIACEKTGRKCYGMEIDPVYCQVIIDRWEKFTGQKAEKVG